MGDLTQVTRSYALLYISGIMKVLFKCNAIEVGTYDVLCVQRMKLSFRAVISLSCVQMFLSRRSCWILRILPLLLTMSS